jgi:glutamate-1-semialdehyde 2,1-aminomutase
MRTLSEEIYQKSCTIIPGGVNSPVRSFKRLGMSPMIVASGSGDMIKDVDGNEYIDFCGSWGSLILGHAHPTIVNAVCEQAHLGTSFGIATELERQLAEKIVSHVPGVEKIRFVSTGTEATMTAVRIARGYTERNKIVRFFGHYHGHSDSLLAERSKGITPGTTMDTITLPFNDFAALKAFFASDEAKQVAALILEPIAINMGVVVPAEGFLKLIREETKRVGALLIFDEVVTGFRLGLGGAQEYFDIDPDLTTFGKIIGGGFPVAAVGGKAKIMDMLAPMGPVYQAGTLSGNPVAMRAGLETLKIIENDGFYEMLAEKTERFLAPIRKTGFPLSEAESMFNLVLEPDPFAEMFRYLFERGVYISPFSFAFEAWFMSAVHTDEHIDYASKTICEYLCVYR